MVKSLSFQVTERDITILRFINEFGFCEMPQIEKRFLLKAPRSYQIMKRLTLAGLVKHQRIFHGRHGVFTLTAEGAKQTSLPAFEKVPLHHYSHHLLVIDIYIKLRQLHPDAFWVSERQLIIDKYADGVGKKGHIADGILSFSNNNQIAIEVELSLKGKTRTERILKWYGSQFSIKEVWYFCHPKVKATLQLLAEKMPFIKIYDVQEFLI